MNMKNVNISNRDEFASMAITELFLHYSSRYSARLKFFKELNFQKNFWEFRRITIEDDISFKRLKLSIKLLNKKINHGSLLNLKKCIQICLLKLKYNNV